MIDPEEKLLNYYLPGTTVNLVHRQAKQTRNMRLLMDKYVPANVIDPEDKSARSRWLQGLVKNNQPDPLVAKATYQRWSRLVNTPNTQVFQGTVDWRMVVGLGGNNILETDITLHHLYGTPIIPGSALKGLTRAYAASLPEFEVDYTVKNTNGNEDTKHGASPDDTQDHPDIKHIFGAQDSAGTVIFFDAVPVDGTASLEVDIMNPHYPKYYQSLGSKEPAKPTNDQDPIPVTFLTVPEANFAFAVGPRNPTNPKHKQDAIRASNWLKTALKDQGVGGKTAAGYGYFINLREIAKPEPVERIRSNVKAPNAGQNVQGTALENTSELRRRLQEPETSSFFRYMEHDPRDIVLVVRQEESADRHWEKGNSANIRVLSSNQVGDCLVVYCQAQPKKSKDKEKKKR